MAFQIPSAFSILGGLNKNLTPKMPHLRGIPTGFNELPVRESLVPYLALDFGIQQTGSTEGLCGLLALEGSLEAARDLVEVGDTKLLTISLKVILKSDEYKRRVFATIATMGYMDHGEWTPIMLDEETYWDNVNAALTKTWLNEQSIRDVLRFANSQLGTFYELGYINEGCVHIRPVRRIPREKAGQNFKEVELSAATVLGDGSQRPILWIYNAEQLHWETMAPNVYHHPSKDKKEKVANWNISDLVKKELENGLYLVMDDIRDAEGYMVFLRGQFLQRHVGPGAAPKGGHLWMRSTTISGDDEQEPKEVPLSHVFELSKEAISFPRPRPITVPDPETAMNFKAVPISADLQRIQDADDEEAEKFGVDLCMYRKAHLGHVGSMNAKEMEDWRHSEIWRRTDDPSMSGSSLFRNRDGEHEVFGDDMMVEIEEAWGLYLVCPIYDPNELAPVHDKKDLMETKRRLEYVGEEVKEEHSPEDLQKLLMDHLELSDDDSEQVKLCEVVESSNLPQGLRTGDLLMPTEHVGTRMMRYLDIDNRTFVLPMSYVRKCFDGETWGIRKPIRNFIRLNQNEWKQTPAKPTAENQANMTKEPKLLEKSEPVIEQALPIPFPGTSSSSPKDAGLQQEAKASLGQSEPLQDRTPYNNVDHWLLEDDPKYIEEIARDLELPALKLNQRADRHSALREHFNDLDGIPIPIKVKRWQIFEEDWQDRVDILQQTSMVDLQRFRVSPDQNSDDKDILMRKLMAGVAYWRYAWKFTMTDAERQKERDEIKGPGFAELQKQFNERRAAMDAIKLAAKEQARKHPLAAEKEVDARLGKKPKGD